MKLPKGKNLILFDGYCHLCSWSVRTILRFDKKQKFLFSPLSSEYGKAHIADFQIAKDVDSVILIKDGEVFTKAKAALMIADELGGIFLILGMFKVFSFPFLNSIYDFVAKNRNKWFGRKNVCMMPTNEQKEQFLL